MADKGKQFLQLINEQNNLQWSIISKVSALVKADWQSDDIKDELEQLTRRHVEITEQLNSIDDDASTNISTNVL